METLKTYWESFVGFLTEYDFAKIMDALRHLDWQKLMMNPLVWLVGLAVLLYTIRKGELRILVLVLSFAGFIYLSQQTLPSAGEPVSLEAMLKFIGGCVLLLIINGYFFFIRGK